MLTAGVLIDVTSYAKNHKNYQVRVEDLERWENYYGTIPDGSVVLIRTGQGAWSHNDSLYTGIDEYDKMNFPGEWE